MAEVLVPGDELVGLDVRCLLAPVTIIRPAVQFSVFFGSSPPRFEGAQQASQASQACARSFLRVLLDKPWRLAHLYRNVLECP